MIGNITLGRYYSSDSFVHSLDPRTKVLFTLLYTVSLFFLNLPIMFVVPFIFLCYELAASKLKLGYVLKGISKILIPFVLIAVLVWLSLGLNEGIVVLIRLILIVLQSSVLTYTTTPGQISNALRKLTGSADISMIICIALRYLPILSSQTKIIYESQKNRGAKYSKVRQSVSLIIPMFASSFRIASNLGTAMDARLYSGKKRSALKELKFTGYDLVFFLLSVAYILLVIWVRYVC